MTIGPKAFMRGGPGGSSPGKSLDEGGGWVDGSIKSMESIKSMKYIKSMKSIKSMRTTNVKIYKIANFLEK